MLLVENGTVYTPSGPVPGGAVLIDGKTIFEAGVRDAVPSPDGAHRLDARGGHIAAGLIDMHMHGALGIDLMNPDPSTDDLARLAAFLPRFGVTSFIPALISGPLGDILKGLRVARDYAQTTPRPRGAKMLGVHVEGPFLNSEQKGAHPESEIHAPDPVEIEQLLAFADLIRWFTLAPELPGAMAAVEALSSHGIVVSAGHTMALEGDLALAIEHGLRHVTHLFGNMGSLRRQNLTRVAGTIETALFDDRLTTEIIGDGYHISPLLMRLAFKCKGPDRLAIVTDASPLMGLPPGRYQLWGSEVVLEDEISFLPDRSAFAGSVLSLDRCVRNVMRLAGVEPVDALRMASGTPAKILGVDGDLGSLAAGLAADLVLLDGDFHVTHTIVDGEVIYDRSRDDAKPEV